ncbi:hypothetical protein KC335_g95 [Hortaea werneckii]|nr:hypothetical protein KC335_g95 [Hortaea werneckii]
MRVERHVDIHNAIRLSKCSVSYMEGYAIGSVGNPTRQCARCPSLQAHASKYSCANIRRCLAAAVKAAAPVRRRPPAHVASSRPSTATVRRLKLRTRLPVLAAHASNVQLAPAPALAPRRRTPSPPVPPVPAAREHPTLALAAALRSWDDCFERSEEDDRVQDVYGALEMLSTPPCGGYGEFTSSRCSQFPEEHPRPLESPPPIAKRNTSAVTTRATVC